MAGKRKAQRGTSPSKTKKMDETVAEGKKFVTEENKRERRRSRSKSPAAKKAAPKKTKTTRGRSGSPKKAPAKKAPAKSPSRKQPNRKAKSPTGRTTNVKIDAPKVSDGKKLSADQRAAAEASNWVTRSNRREKKSR